MLPLCNWSCFSGCLPTRLPSILLLGLLYVIYVLTGGAVFWKLEGPPMAEQMRSAREELARLQKKMPCLNEETIVMVAKVLQKATSNGLSLKDNHTADGVWKFTTSAVFAATVVTTIGYGNISPTTTAGQIFCVFFALFGIPLNVVVLNKIGKYMLVIGRMVSSFIEQKLNQKRGISVLVHLISFVSGVTIFFVVPMLVFKVFEGWTYSQAIYYCFITLSTIGFGDYVADDNPERVYPDWYGPLMGMWIFFGLAWLALLINHSIELLEEYNKQWKGGEGNEDAGDAGDAGGQPDTETVMTEIQTPDENPPDSGNTETANQEEEPQK